MPRVDQLPENAMMQELKEVMRAQEQIKAYQYAGASSVVMQRVFSPNAVDISFSSVGFRDKAFYLVWTPEVTGLNTGLAYKMEFTSTEGSGGSVDFFVERQKVEANNVQRWLIALNSSDAFPNSLVEMKFFLWVSGNGTMSFEVL